MRLMVVDTPRIQFYYRMITFVVVLTDFLALSQGVFYLFSLKGIN